MISRGNGDFHSIVLIKVIWKTVIEILNSHLTSEIQFHNYLNGFFNKRNMGTAYLRSKLLHSEYDSYKVGENLMISSDTKLTD